MSHAQITDSVRRIVIETLASVGLSDSDQPQETILIRDGAYCGRRFDASRGHAVWFVEEEQIKFFRADGSLACAIEAVTTSPTMRQAA